MEISVGILVVTFLVLVWIFSAPGPVVEIVLHKGDERYRPTYQSEDAACCDLVACLDEPLALEPGRVTKVFVGFRVQIAKGWEMQIRSRSGMADRGIFIANGVGTVDADYRGDVKVMLYNSTPAMIWIRDGDRIAQAKFAECPRPCRDRTDGTKYFNRVESLETTERGEGGFGSTDRLVKITSRHPTPIHLSFVGHGTFFDPGESKVFKESAIDYERWRKSAGNNPLHIDVEFLS